MEGQGMKVSDQIAALTKMLFNKQVLHTTAGAGDWMTTCAESAHQLVCNICCRRTRAVPLRSSNDGILSQHNGGKTECKARAGSNFNVLQQLEHYSAGFIGTERLFWDKMIYGTRLNRRGHPTCFKTCRVT
eukprot:1142191-Pelagomonas_calceolata.AAC.6